MNENTPNEPTETPLSKALDEQNKLKLKQLKDKLKQKIF